MATTANTLTSVMHKILSRSLSSLRTSVVVPRLVNSDWSTEAAKKGDVINVPIPVAKTASAVTPAETPPAPAAYNPDTIQIPLDQWYSSDFHLNDKDMTQIAKDEHFMPMALEESVQALAKQVNDHLFTTIRQEAGYSVQMTTDGTPFAKASDSGVTDAVLLRKKLSELLAPKDMRRLIVDYEAEAQMLQNAAFRDASQSSESGPVIRGEIGRKLGFDIFTDDAVPTHTPGTADGYLVNSASLVKGSTVIPADTGTGTILVGDSVSFAGDTDAQGVQREYAVTSALSGGSFTIAAPGLRATVADNTAITVASNDGAAYPLNIAFHRNAIAFATRPLVQSMADRELGSRIASQQDPVSGLVLRLEVSRQHKQTVWDLDILWGARVTRPEHVVRLRTAAA